MTDAISVRLSEVSYAYRRSGSFKLTVSWATVSPRTVLLGPNGAGKTTMLSIIAGVLRPASGHVEVGGLSLDGGDRAAYLRAVGWMPQQIAPIAGLSCREQIAYVGWLKGLGKSEAWDRAVGTLADVDLAELADRRTSDISGGQLRRISLAQALITRPSLLLLDEPTAGLDPNQRSNFRDLVAGLPGEVAVLVSTHQVDDIADTFDDVAIMSEGAIVWHGPLTRFMGLATDGSVRPAEAAYRTIVHESD